MSGDELWVVLPVKAWAAAKRRLSPVLSGAERARLARSMLEDVLAAVFAASDQARIAGVLAVTSDAVAGGHLEAAGCELLPETRRGLNRALDSAARELEVRGARTMLILPVDVPLVSPRDLERLASRHLGAEGAPVVTVAPDRFRSGTNALVVTPPRAIPFRFGDGSFFAHLQEAERAGADGAELSASSLDLDLDHPDDLDELLRRDESSRSARFLKEAGVGDRLGRG